MNILLNYMVKLGKYDNNDDVFEWTITDVSEEVEKAFTYAVMTGTDFEDMPELQAVCARAYKEIEQEQLKKLRDDKDDGFAIECFMNGKNPFEHGYKITVFFPDEEIIPEDEEIEAYLTDAIEAHDLRLTEAIVLEQYENYSGNLIEKALEIAERVGFQELLDKNKKD